MMRALDQEVSDAVFAAVKELIPAPPAPSDHPLGFQRRRISDEICFRGLLLRIVTGAAWETIEYMLNKTVSDTTLRSRRDEWIDAGVFDQLETEALAAYDTIIGFDLQHVCIDGSNHKAPCGGQGTGRNPFDRNKLGWKWSIAVDGAGIPIANVIDSANTNDYKLLWPTLQQLVDRDLARFINTLHLDRGYGYKTAPERITTYDITNINMQMRNQPNQGTTPLIGLGKRWKVEVANSWLSNYGQLRRNTDRKTKHRKAALQLAIALLITSRLTQWANHTWRPQPTPANR